MIEEPDIVVTLRSFAESHRYGSAGYQCGRAADEIERLRRDCAEAYQAVGTIDSYLFTSEEAPPYGPDDLVRLLDNLSAAADGEPRPHDDLLPWPKGE